MIVLVVRGEEALVVLVKNLSLVSAVDAPVRDFGNELGDGLVCGVAANG